MHPILFRIPIPGWKLPYLGEVSSIPIYSYGVMLGLSLIVGWYLTLHLADRDGLPKETMANCYVVTAIVAMIGSRLLYVLTNLSEFEHLGDVFALRRGGYVAYGGFLGGLLGSWLYLRRYKIPLLPWADVAVPSLASGLFITRIGCYLFGCDFGKPLTASAPQWLQKIGTFPHWPQGTLGQGEGAPAWVHHAQHQLVAIDSTHSLPVHPTQIYESLGGLALLGLLLWQRKAQKFRGQTFMVFAFAYGCFRFLIEIVRDDVERGLYGPHLSEDVMIPGAILIFALAYTLSFAQSVENEVFRRLTQVLAFIPAIVAYLALRPPSFADAVLIQFSTSQWIGLLTAGAAAIGFALYWRVAQAHPEQAMALDLAPFHAFEKELEQKRMAREQRAGSRKAEPQHEQKDDSATSDEQSKPADESSHTAEAESRDKNESSKKDENGVSPKDDEDTGSADVDKGSEPKT